MYGKQNNLRLEIDSRKLTIYLISPYILNRREQTSVKSNYGQ
jgi:hypothetical protein